MFLWRRKVWRERAYSLVFSRSSLKPGISWRGCLRKRLSMRRCYRGGKFEIKRVYILVNGKVEEAGLSRQCSLVSLQKYEKVFSRHVYRWKNQNRSEVCEDEKEWGCRSFKTTRLVSFQKYEMAFSEMFTDENGEVLSLVKVGKGKVEEMKLMAMVALHDDRSCLHTGFSRWKHLITIS